ncbi:MAG: MopE-related protein [Pseudomonadota bacterium]|nr:MopE-related protein [Pseudomonadota bacterium]
MRLLLLCLPLAACVDKGAPVGDPSGRDIDTAADPAPPTDADGDGAPDDEDCAPDSAAIHPGAVEACNGVDDNCDGAVDEGVTPTWYTDADADGYAGSAVEACEMPSGAATTAPDCDDADAAVSPGGVEVCGDGVDDDCTGADRTCPASGEMNVGTVATSYRGGPDGRLGFGGSRAGDVDGDGLGDVWVSGLGYGAAEAAGGVFLVPGSVTGEHLVESVATLTLYSTTSRARAGSNLAGGHDLDGDGVPDVAIGAEGAWTYGAVYIVSGTTTGTMSLAAAAGLITAGSEAYAGVGCDVSTSPDLTGDGVGDVIVGSFGVLSDGFLGAAWILAGPVTGEHTVDEAIVIRGDQRASYAGNSVAGLGDVNGDGAADLLVGAYGSDLGDDGAGAVGVFHGPVLGDAVLSDADRLVGGETTDDWFSRGTIGGQGDVDGDGLDDFLVGAPYNTRGGSNAGAGYLVSGSATAAGLEYAAAATVRVYGDEPEGYLGFRQDLADVDGDGHADLLLSGPRVDTGGADAGAVFLFYGPIAGAYTAADADARYVGEAAGDALGWDIANVGDTNGDGVDDLLLGAWSNDAYGAGGGAAYLVR